MKKLLRFEIKQNLRRPTRIYVKSQDQKIIYGYFHTDNPESFDGWEQLSQEQQVELQLFIQNIQAINTCLGKEASNKMIDFRFRLPLDFVETIHEISKLLAEDDIKINLFESALTGMIQQLKIGTAKLLDEKKNKALILLDKIGLAEYKKLDMTAQIQAVFSELISIRDRSKKLHEQALLLFEKNKSYSTNAIAGMAKGESIPSKWLVACAIEILRSEKPQILQVTLSDNDLFMLWAKQLLDQGHDVNNVLNKAHFLNKEELIHKIEQYISHVVENKA